MSIWHKPSDIPKDGSSIIVYKISKDVIIITTHKYSNELLDYIAKQKAWAYVEDIVKLDASNVITTTVREDGGGYPYIPAIELYDYSNDKPLAKAGDTVEVIIRKVNE